MSNPVRMPQGRDRFVLAVPPPLRAWGLAALGSVVGAVLLVWARAAGLPTAVVVLGAVLLVLGLVLAGAAALLTARSRTVLLLDATTLTVANGPRRKVLAWSEVDDVTVDSARMIIRRKGGARPEVVLVNPRQQRSASFDDLVYGLRARLDASRGYRD